MDGGVAFVADPQTANVVQVRNAALDDPALSPDAGTVLGAAPRDHRLDPSRPQQPAVFVVVIAAVSDDYVGFLAWSPPLASHRAGVHRVQQRQQLSDVVAVAAGQRDGERDAGRIDEEMVL